MDVEMAQHHNSRVQSRMLGWLVHQEEHISGLASLDVCVVQTSACTQKKTRERAF